MGLGFVLAISSAFVISLILAFLLIRLRHFARRRVGDFIAVIGRFGGLGRDRKPALAQVASERGFQPYTAILLGIMWPTVAAQMLMRLMARARRRQPSAK